MDPYNLGICFGPTLLPIPPDRDQVSNPSNIHVEVLISVSFGGIMVRILIIFYFQVQYQNYVNDLIKTIVCHHEEAFSNIEGGVVYEKSIIEDW